MSAKTNGNDGQPWVTKKSIITGLSIVGGLAGILVGMVNQALDFAKSNGKRDIEISQIRSEIDKLPSDDWLKLNIGRIDQELKKNHDEMKALEGDLRDESAERIKSLFELKLRLQALKGDQ